MSEANKAINSEAVSSVRLDGETVVIPEVPDAANKAKPDEIDKMVEFVLGGMRDGTWLKKDEVYLHKLASLARLAPKWISVKEQMPEPGDVLISYFSNIDGVALVNEADYDGEEFWVAGDRMEYERENLTHWMPKPKAPAKTPATPSPASSARDGKNGGGE